MQITLVHQVAADFLAVSVSKQHIVRQHHSSPCLAVGLQAAVDVLEKVQLLVAGGESEVIPGGTLAALLGAERRIGEHQVKVVEGFALVGQGVGQQNLTVDVVEHGVHQSQTVSVVDQLAAGEGFLPLEFCLICIQIVKIIGVFLDIPMGGNHKAKGAAGRVVAPLAGLGLHQPGHHINEDTRGEVLARAGLFLVGVLLQQPFIQVAQPLFPGGVPVQTVDSGDDLFQVLGLVDVGGGTLVDLSHSTGAVFTQMSQQLFIELLQLDAAFGSKLIPAVGSGNLAFLLSHILSTFESCYIQLN